MDSGDLLMVTHYGRIYDQIWNMTQVYEVGTGTPIPPLTGKLTQILAALADRTKTLFTTYINGQQIAAFYYDGCKGYNMFTQDEVGDAPLPTPYQGGAVGDGFAPFVSVVLKSPTTRRDVRSGHKFIPGVGEGSVSSGGYLIGTQRTQYQLFADNFGDTQYLVYNGPDFINLHPKICGRIFTGIVNGRRRYRLPSVPSEAITFDANYAVEPIVSTMNSRKYDRGV